MKLKLSNFGFFALAGFFLLVPVLANAQTAAQMAAISEASAVTCEQAAQIALGSAGKIEPGNIESAYGQAVSNGWLKNTSPSDPITLSKLSYILDSVPNGDVFVEIIHATDASVENLKDSISSRQSITWTQTINGGVVEWRGQYNYNSQTYTVLITHQEVKNLGSTQDYLSGVLQFKISSSTIIPSWYNDDWNALGLSSLNMPSGGTVTSVNKGDGVYNHDQDTHIGEVPDYMYYSIRIENINLTPYNTFVSDIETILNITLTSSTSGSSIQNEYDTYPYKIFCEYNSSSNEIYFQFTNRTP